MLRPSRDLAFARMQAERMDTFEWIWTFVRRVQRRRRWRVLSEIALICMHYLLILASIGSLVVLAYGPGWPIRLASFVLASVVMTGAVATGICVIVLLRRDPLGAAKTIDRYVPGLYDGVSSCVQFFPLRKHLCMTHGASSALLDLLARRTAALLHAVQPGQIISMRLIGHMALAFGIMIAGMAGGIAWHPEVISKGLTGLLFGPIQPVIAPAHQSYRFMDVVVGDIEVSYHYPPYTRLADRTESNGTGDLKALAGTHVGLRTHSLMPVRRAEVVLATDRNRPIVQHVSEDGTLTGNLQVLKPDQYHFRVETQDGQWFEETTERSIEIQPDGPPTVQLFVPPADREIRADETIDFRFVATDDFGIVRIEIVTQVQRKDSLPQRRSILAPEGQTQIRGQAQLDLRELHLRPGDQVEAWIEATDQNQDPGHNLGHSEHRFLNIFSNDEKHEELLTLQRELAEQMLANLAERLEMPNDPQIPGFRSGDRPDQTTRTKAIVQQARSLLERFAELLARTNGGTLAPLDVVRNFSELASRLQTLTDMELGLLQRLKAAAEKGGETAGHLHALEQLNAQTIDELEQAIILTDQMLDRQHHARVIAECKKILSQQQELLQQIQQLEATSNDAETIRFVREFENMEHALQAMLAGLHVQSKIVPDEGFNRSALGSKTSVAALDALASAIRQMREMVKTGQMTATRERLTQLTKDTQAAISLLEADQARQSQDNIGQWNRILLKLGRSLIRLSEEQDLLHDETESQEADYEDKVKHLLHDPTDRVFRRLIERVARINQRLGQVHIAALHSSDRKAFAALQQHVAVLSPLLRQGDLGQAVKIVARLETQTEQLADEVERGALLAREETILRPLKANRRFLADAQDMVRELLHEVQRRLPAPAEILDRTEQRQMYRLGERQRRLYEKLQHQHARMDEWGQDNFGFQQQIGKMLDEIGTSMKQAGEQLERLNPNLAEEHQRSALDRLAQVHEELKQATGPNRQGTAERVTQGPDHDPMSIPEAEDYQVPAEFREELLRAMRETGSGPYQKVIEAYYEALIQP